ncbi:putative reverse transcriptase domain-containing protein [Tanacetum coccineum]
MSSLLKRSPSLNGGVGAINEEAAFSTVLSKSLMQAPILALPEGSEDFIAYCDASKKSLGAVLMQKNGVSHLKDLEDIRLYGTKCTIKQRMQAARDRQKSYVDLKRKPMEFQVKDKRVAAAMAEAEASRVRNGYNSNAASQVKFATCTLQDDALTWWNAHVKTTTTEAAHAMTWAALKKMMTDKY